MYMIVNLAMGAKNFEGVGFVDAKSPATVEFQIDDFRLSAWFGDESEAGSRCSVSSRVGILRSLRVFAQLEWQRRPRD
jgi:hypothetical protein